MLRGGCIWTFRREELKKVHNFNQIHFICLVLLLLVFDNKHKVTHTHEYSTWAAKVKNPSFIASAKIRIVLIMHRFD